MWDTKFGDKKVQIARKFIWNGSTLQQWGLNGQDLEVLPIFKDMNIRDVENYFSYLQNGDFEVTDKFNKILKHDYGIENSYNFDNAYWKQKCQSDRISGYLHDNLDFFKENPTFGLKEYPFKMTWDISKLEILKILGENAVVAGGSLVGDKFNDIDIFFVGKIDKEKVVRDVLNYIIKGQLADRLEITQNYIQFFNPSIQKVVQIVFRIYTCISEMAHTFDIDCCGVCFWNGKLWATGKAIYARENMINHASPDAVTLTWASRLGKYVDRGFSVKLPKFDKNRFDVVLLKKSLKGNLYNALVEIRTNLEKGGKNAIVTPQNILMIGSVLEFGMFKEGLSFYHENGTARKSGYVFDVLCHEKYFTLNCYDNGVVTRQYGRQNYGEYPKVDISILEILKLPIIWRENEKDKKETIKDIEAWYKESKYYK